MTMILGRSIQRVALEAQCQFLALPPTFLLPLRARLSTTANFVKPNPPPESLRNAGVFNVTPAPLSTRPRQSALRQSTCTQPSSPLPPPPTSPLPPLSPSVKELLPLLRAQPSHYITAHIHARPYLLTLGDTLRLPFHMPLVRPGDVLRLTRASSIGSRDYTMQGAPYLDERLFECRAVVAGTEAEPMRVLEKTKRRQRHVKHVKTKLRFTILKVKELRVRSLEEVEGEREAGKDHGGDEGGVEVGNKGV
ncbi:MAG: hypothetical protein Q9187_003680 [Circinaria calcarea]